MCFPRTQWIFQSPGFSKRRPDCDRGLLPSSLGQQHFAGSNHEPEQRKQLQAFDGERERGWETL